MLPCTVYIPLRRLLLLLPPVIQRFLHVDGLSSPIRCHPTLHPSQTDVFTMMSTWRVGSCMMLSKDTHDFELRPQDENVQCRAREEDYGAEREVPPVKIITLCFLRHTFYACRPTPGRRNRARNPFARHPIAVQQ